MFRFIQVCLLFLVFIGLNLPAFAGDNIPSTQDVQYAKEVYKLMTDFDAKESKFAENASSKDPINNTQMENIFKEKFNYTKQYYLELKTKQPTSKFIPSNKQLQNGLYKMLQYIQIVIGELDKNIKVNEITAQHSKTFHDANDIYSEGVKGFVTIVRSWQRPYINKVMPAKQPSTH